MAKHVFVVEVQAPDELRKGEVKKFVADAVTCESGYYEPPDPRANIKHLRIIAPHPHKPKAKKEKTLCPQTPTTEQSKPADSPSWSDKMRRFFGL